MIGLNKQLLRSKTIAACALLAAGSLVIFGCSGTTSSNVAHIRAVNAIPNGGSSTTFINSGSANGTQNYGQTSSYLFINGGTTVITFALSSYSTTTYESISRTLNNGSAYTVVLYGRADLPAADPRTPKLSLLTDDFTRTTGNTAMLRIFNAAPDAGTITSATFTGTPVATNLNYGNGTDHISVPSGSGTLTIMTSSGATVTQTLNLSSGQGYTILLSEPTIPSGSTAATFGTIQLTDL